LGSSQIAARFPVNSIRSWPPSGIKTIESISPRSISEASKRVSSRPFRGIYDDELGRHPFDLGFTSLRASDVDADAGPGLAPIRDGESHVDRPVVKQERLAFAAE